MLKILVTGVNGFVGKHLVRELKARDYEVVGIGHSEVDPEIEKLLLRYESCDLTDTTTVDKLKLDDVNAVIHLAGLTRSRASLNIDEAYNEATVRMFSLIANRLLEAGSTPRIIAVSTGLVYDSSQSMPLTEDSKTLEQSSPYVFSKLLMEDAARQLRQAGLDCVIARPLNHSGPGQTPGYLIPDIYQKLVAFRQDGQPIPVSPKQTKRDYTDVRDVVKAYVDLAVSEKLTFDTYNICSGQSRSAQEIMTIMQVIMNLPDVQTKIDESFVRPNDPMDLYGSYDRIQEETGWGPTIPFEQTIKDFTASEERKAT